MPHKVGDLRPSQAIFTYGVGASVELPHITGIVMGLEEWDTGYGTDITEGRVLRAVQSILGPQVVKLLSPPIPKTTGGPSMGPKDEDKIGIPVATFPTWLRCPACNHIGKVDSGLFELKPDPYRPDRTCYRHVNCQRATGVNAIAVPVRFVVACEHGHFDDFPWIDYVHGGVPCQSPRLRIQELGLSGAASDVLVVCDQCSKKRTLTDAFGEDNRRAMPNCRARRPHLRDYESPADDLDRACDRQMKALLLGASNSWFPLTVAAMYIPGEDGKLGQLVESNWAILENVTSLEVLRAFRSALRAEFQPLAAYGDEDVFAEITRKKKGGDNGDEGEVDLKRPEWEMLSRADATRNVEDFFLESAEAPKEFAHLIQQVVLVVRLREVRALVGFSRIDSPGDFGEMITVPEDRRMPLSRSKPTWVPASEVRGEGIFVRFDERGLAEWLGQREVVERGRFFRQAHTAWRKARHIADPDAGFPGMRFVVLHSFCHALMRQIAVECGYTAASIRERIYSREPHEAGGPMAGFLIYTAAPDSEGTLGGLVSLGAPEVLGRHIRQALDQLAQCASDPLCAEHMPHLGMVSLHAAACHACLFSPETSCERGNKYLDRNVLVSTVNPFAKPILSRTM